MKKILALILCAAMCLSLFSLSHAESLPEYTGNMVKLSEDPAKLTMWITFDSSRYKQQSYADVPSMVRMSEITNVYPEFIHPASGSEKEQLNLVMSNPATLPDIIYYNWSKTSMNPDQLYEDGLIINLADYLDYAPNLRARMEADPSIRKNITTDSGLMPGFFQMQFSVPLKNTYAYLLRADWLKKVGKEVPVTLDDWYDVLCAFRDNDMDGDGDPSNEYPLTGGMFTDNEDCLAIEYLYGAWGKTWKLYVNGDGHIAYGAYDPDYKEYLKLVRKWIVEGLIDPDFATNDKARQDAKFLNSQAGALRSGMGAGFGTFIAGLKDENAIVAAMTPVMKAGDTSYNWTGLSAGVTSDYAVITTNCKNPEMAVKWLDMFYGNDGMMLANYGIEGEAYNMIDGYPTLVDYITRNPDGKSINVALAEFSLGCSGFPFWNDTAVREQRMLSYPAQRESGIRMAEMSQERRVPLVSLTSDETMEYSGLMSDIETYVKEATMAFLLGDVDIDEGFDAYMEELKGMGIEDAIAIYEGALQRYNAR